MKKIIILIILLIPTFVFAIQTVPGNQIIVSRNNDSITAQQATDDIYDKLSNVKDRLDDNDREIGSIQDKISNSEIDILSYECGDIGGFPYEIKVNLSNIQAFRNNNDAVTGNYNLKLPSANPNKVGFIIIYIDVKPSKNFKYNILNNNIIAYPENNIPWVDTDKDSTWKIEFESILGTTKWYYMKATQFILQ